MDSGDIKATMALTCGEGPLEAVRPGVRPYESDGIGRLLKPWTKYEIYPNTSQTAATYRTPFTYLAKAH